MTDLTRRASRTHRFRRVEVGAVAGDLPDHVRRHAEGQEQGQSEQVVDCLCLVLHNAGNGEEIPLQKGVRLGEVADSCRAVAHVRCCLDDRLEDGLVGLLAETLIGHGGRRYPPAPAGSPGSPDRHVRTAPPAGRWHLSPRETKGEGDLLPPISTYSAPLALRQDPVRPAQCSPDVLDLAKTGGVL
jgi:hypothetical protein